MSKRSAEVQLTQDNVDEIDEATDEVLKCKYNECKTSFTVLSSSSHAHVMSAW